MMNSLTLLALLSSVAWSASWTTQLVPEELVWTTPANLPAGTKMAVLEGDPKQQGLFTIRLELPANTEMSPHRHPRDERVVVLSGSISVGFGEEFDKSRG